MSTAVCVACAAPLRAGARFCTRCGTAVAVAAEQASTTDAPTPPVLEVAVAPPEPSAAAEVPARIPIAATASRPPLSGAALGTLATGVAPLIVSVAGNAVASTVGIQAVEAINEGRPEGAWVPLLVTLTIVFLGNAALLVVCAMLGGRALRETAGGVVRGRPFAVAGLAAGAVNLVLWVAGLVLTVGSYSAILG